MKKQTQMRRALEKGCACVHDSNLQQTTFSILRFVTFCCLRWQPVVFHASEWFKALTNHPWNVTVGRSHPLLFGRLVSWGWACWMKQGSKTNMWFKMQVWVFFNNRGILALCRCRLLLSLFQPWWIIFVLIVDSDIYPQQMSDLPPPVARKPSGVQVMIIKSKQAPPGSLPSSPRGISIRLPSSRTFRTENTVCMLLCRSGFTPSSPSAQKMDPVWAQTSYLKKMQREKWYVCSHSLLRLAFLIYKPFKWMKKISMKKVISWDRKASGGPGVRRVADENQDHE